MGSGHPLGLSHCDSILPITGRHSLFPNSFPLLAIPDLKVRPLPSVELHGAPWSFMEEPVGVTTFPTVSLPQAFPFLLVLFQSHPSLYPGRLLLSPILPFGKAKPVCYVLLNL